MINPSTGEFHLEGVPAKDDNSWDHIPNETVLGALSWRDGETVDISVKDGEEASTWEYVRTTTITQGVIMNLFIKGEIWDRYAEIIAVEDMHLSEITPE